MVLLLAPFLKEREIQIRKKFSIVQLIILPFPYSQPGLKENPALHFDAEAFEEAKQLLYVRNNQINIVAGDGKFSTMRNLLGKSLHSMQKFYSHSNWVEMGNDAILDLIWDDFGNIASNKTDTCNENDLTVDVLTSGYFHYNVSMYMVQL